MAGLQVGWALGCSVLVWGQQFQSPMFLGTQPPYAMKALIDLKYNTKRKLYSIGKPVLVYRCGTSSLHKVPYHLISE